MSEMNDLMKEIGDLVKKMREDEVFSITQGAATESGLSAAKVEGDKFRRSNPIVTNAVDSTILGFEKKIGELCAEFATSIRMVEPEICAWGTKAAVAILRCKALVLEQQTRLLEQERQRIADAASRLI